jgi:GTP-binding protein
MVADDNLYTLLDLRYNRHHFAGDGEPGGKNHRKGKDGDDIVLRVPPGTIAKLTDTGEVVGEVDDPGERIVLAQGGRGGKGNAFFKSSTNQTPRHAQPGEEGEEKDITLELKLLADIGLVGFPNAGKSTLISSISAARPKVADYPFTTLEPALGVVYVGDFESFVMADIPGIIEGAHEGKGLGVQFLKHIERNAVLLFVIPITSGNPGDDYETLLDELRSYNPHLLSKPRMVAISKMDLLPPEERDAYMALFRDEFPEDVDLLPISSVAHVGLDQLKRTLYERVKQERAYDDVEEVPDAL